MRGGSGGFAGRAAPQAQGCRAGVHYHRLNAVLDAKHLKLDEGGDAPLRDLRLLALDQVGGVGGRDHELGARSKRRTYETFHP